MAAIANTRDQILQATVPRMLEVTPGVPKTVTVFLFKRTPSSVTPDLPSADVTYSFSACVASGITEGWTQTMPVIGGPYRWMTSAVADGTADVVTIATDAWAEPALISQDGDDGDDGVRGTVNVAAATTGTSWSNLEAALAVGAAGYGAPQDRDVVTMYNVAAHYAETRYYDAGGWIALGAYVNGNLLVDGTVVAEKLAADAVTANAMAANSITAANGAIADLAVSTLKIQGNAVTVPVTGNYTGPYAGGGTALSYTFYVDLAEDGTLFASASAVQGYTGGSVPAWQMTLVIGGVLVYDTGTVSAVWQQSVSVSGARDCSAGTVSVTITWASASSAAELGTISAFAVGAMR